MMATWLFTLNAVHTARASLSCKRGYHSLDDSVPLWKIDSFQYYPNGQCLWRTSMATAKICGLVRPSLMFSSRALHKQAKASYALQTMHYPVSFTTAFHFSFPDLLWTKRKARISPQQLWKRNRSFFIEKLVASLNVHISFHLSWVSLTLRKGERLAA